MQQINKSDLKRIFEQHNNIVNDRYTCDLDALNDWVMMDGNFDENYIEIPGYQTKSGSPVILDW